MLRVWGGEPIPHLQLSSLEIMDNTGEESLVYGIKLSSVGPSRQTGTDVVHDLSGTDLAMKLHYLKVVHFFNSHAAQGLTVPRLKETIFEWLNTYYYTCGRLRRLESGRPYIKCNDCGCRFIEARCDKTIQEWLEMKDWSLQKQLVSQQVIGPELSFSPPVLLQVTFFKCGGLSLGLSWSHILGDAFTAAELLNGWGQLLSGLQPHKPSKFPKSDLRIERSKDQIPLSMKQVDPVGDLWTVPNGCKMGTFSCHVSATQLGIMQSEISAPDQTLQIPIFESLCAIVWQSMAKVRKGNEPKTVTVCKKDPTRPTNAIVTNTQIISAVEAEFSIAETDPKKLATWLVNQAVDERSRIEASVERDDGVSDFFVYGANLTFVDLGEANFYGMVLNGYVPEFVYVTIKGVGDEGAVFVLPGPTDSGKDNEEGRILTVILPENQVQELKSELRKNGLCCD